MNIDLTGKTALVTGGSKGIGEGAARALSQAGATVIICARNGEEATKTAQKISGETGHTVKAYVADVTRQEDVDKMIHDVEAEYKGVDILVNNAGSAGTIAPFMDVPAQDYLDLYDQNVVSMVRFTKAVLPYMRSKKWGRIINISSENGLQPYPDMMQYNLTKAANLSFSKGLSKLVGAEGILVNSVSPAFIYTPLVDTMMEKMAGEKGISKDDAVQEFIRENRPTLDLKRPGTIEEVGAAVVFLASEQASFINGTNLRVDGGSVASI
ncbi:MAG: SDR family oxidoreductase [Mucilaginibacter polytrichastri]|nr:SDR family oxidoreductase [Mucilaginibacter polytrichastri]